MATFGLTTVFVLLCTWQLVGVSARLGNSGLFSIVKEKFAVPEGGLTCAEIAKKNEIPLSHLLLLNAGLNSVCGSVTNPLLVTEGTTVAVASPSSGDLSPCTTVYSSLKGDTCGKVVSKFSDDSHVLDLPKLNELNTETDLNCQNSEDILQPQTMVCVRRGEENMAEISSENNHYVVKEGDNGCGFLDDNMTKAVDFFSLNPGVDCDHLVPGHVLNLSGVTTCTKICTYIQTTAVTMTCAAIRSCYFQGLASVMCKYDSTVSFLCTSDTTSVAAKTNMCTPAAKNTC